MPLVIIDAYPSDQVVLNTDDVVLIHHTGTMVEVRLRGQDERIFLPHSTVAEAAADLDVPENLVLRNNLNQS